MMTKNTGAVPRGEFVDGGSIDLDEEHVYLPDGSRLTEDRAEQLAEELLESVGRGRPSLTGQGRRSPQLRLSVSQQLRDHLDRRARDEGRTISEIAREALEHYLAS